MLTRKDGLKIADKLGATKKEGKKHSLYRVIVRNTYVGGFGLPRGSKGRNRNLNWIPKQIGLTTHQAKQLSDCILSKEDYIGILESGGRLNTPS